MNHDLVEPVEEAVEEDDDEEDDDDDVTDAEEDASRGRTGEECGSSAEGRAAST